MTSIAPKLPAAFPPWAGIAATLCLSIVGAWVNLSNRVAALEVAQAQQTEITRELRTEVRTLNEQMTMKLDRIMAVRSAYPAQPQP